VSIESESRHTFAVSTTEIYWRELCLNLEYQERLYCEALGCRRMDVLEHSGDFEHGMRRKLRFEKPIDAPSAITKLFGSAVTVEEHSEFDAKEQRWSYRIVPAMLADRIDIRGVVRAAEQSGAVEQIARASVNVRLLGLGSIIEHFVAKSTEEGTRDKADFTRRYIAERGLR
jgi:hypothetical protein